MERRAHKQSSSKQLLSKTKNKSTRSPGCTSRRSGVKLQSCAQKNQKLFKKHDRHVSSTGGQSVAAESWQSPEHASRLGSITPDMEERDQPLRSEASKDSSGVQEDSVLAKYIERFRHGLPQSRKQRQPVTPVSGEEQEPLWWMFHSSSPCGKQTKTLHKDDHDSAVTHDGSVTLFSDTSQEELEDSDVLQLQDRASRLILENEEDLNTGSVHVSSGGLGFSDFSSPVSVDEFMPQPLTPGLMKPAKSNSDSIHAFQKSFLPTLTPPTRPEEDILFQWRLRRKLEQARDQCLQSSSFPGSTFSWQAPRLTDTPGSGLISKQQTTCQSADSSQTVDHPHAAALQPEAHRQTPPAYVVSSSSVPPSVSNVPPHTHLLCDVLPCPVQLHLKEKQSITQKSAHKTIQVPDSSAICLGEHSRSSPHASPGATEGEELSHQQIPQKAKTKEPEKTGAPKQKRRSARERCQKKMTPREESQEFPAVYEPPPSPVHVAMGQVVSEVLFPVSSISPDHTIPPAKKSPVSSCEALNSLEVISQLLQEAEDSDEKEFENDPLLQVLRQQRKWVKNQIRNVDVMLNEFPEEQQVI
ncbi:proline and serine-rich protein 3 [Oryzias latipes]|uniref:proline and serine-rich protein 3 n=1 Tax=Oryzias latipes TaxID=8090 RepID=UPI0005CB8243|nr:proline and serine-rich protein 3 [Oryzias latipes]